MRGLSKTRGTKIVIAGILSLVGISLGIALHFRRQTVPVGESRVHSESTNSSWKSQELVKNAQRGRSGGLKEQLYSGDSITSLPVLRESLRSPALKERDGSFAVNTESYGANFTRNSIMFGNMGKDTSGPIRFTYQLASVKVGDSEVEFSKECDPEPAPDGGSIFYRRGQIEEHYTIKPEGLEQDFIIRSLPPKRGAITVRGTLGCTPNLVAPPDKTTAKKLSFSRDGRDGLCLSDAVAFDGTGRRISLDLTYQSGELSIYLPAQWVQEAQLPITIDPLLSSRVGLTNSNANLSVAYNTELNEYAVIFTEFFGVSGVVDTYCQRVSWHGTLIGTRQTITTNESTNGVDISYAPSPVNAYLAVWQQYLGDPDFRYVLKARILNSDLSFHGSGLLTIENGFVSNVEHPSIAYDGTQWFVAYNLWNFAWDIWGRFVTTAGVVDTTARQIDSATDIATFPSVDFANNTYLISWLKGPSAVAQTVAGRTMTTTGTFPTSITTVSQSSNHCEFVHTSAGSGKFLVAWQESTGTSRNILGRLVTSSLTFETSAFTVASGVNWMREVSSCFSSDQSKWAVFYAGSGDELKASQVSTTGTVSGPEQLTSEPTTVSWPVAAWNPTYDDFLLVYSEDAQAHAYVQIYTQRSVPIAPTGVTATPGDSQIQVSWSAVSGATGYWVKRCEVSGGPYFEIAFTTTTSMIDSEVYNAYSYYYVVNAVNSAGIGPDSTEVSTSPSAMVASILFVHGNANPNASDNALKNRLTAMGYAVTMRRDTLVTTPEATGKAVVVVSSTVNPANITTKFRTVTVPVLTWENAIYRNTYMGMTGPTSGTDYGTQASQSSVGMVAANSSHPMAAGLTGTVGVLTSGTSTFNWGKPNANAVSIATVVTNVNRHLIFGYEKDSAMAGGINAPARRVGFFLGDTTGSSLNANGWALFEAAIRWAAGVPDPLTSLMVNEWTDRVWVSWHPVIGATSYTVYRSLTGLPGSFVPIAVGLTGLEYIDTAVTLNTDYYYDVRANNAGGVSQQGPIRVGRPATQTLLVAITGNPRLKMYRPGQPFVEPAQLSTYRAYVYINNNNVVTQIANNQLLAGSGFNITVNPQYVGLTTKVPDTAPPSPAPNSQTDAVSIVYNNNDLTDVKWAELTFTAKVAGFADKNVSTRLWLHAREVLTVHFHFPTNTVGRTTREWPIGSGSNQFFVNPGNPTDPTREAARQGWVNWFTPQVEAYLNKTCVGIYPQFDNTMTLQLDGFFGTGFEAEDLGDIDNPNDNVATPAFNALRDRVQQNPSWANIINVFLVQHVAATSNTGHLFIQGETGRDLPGGLGGRFILLSDPQPDLPNDMVLAHEMLHACSRLRDVFNVDRDITGILNNLKPIYGVGQPGASTLNPMNWNLMRWRMMGQRTDFNGWWLTEHQTERAYWDSGKHPAWNKSD